MRIQQILICLLISILLYACNNQSTEFSPQPSATPWSLPPTWTPATTTFTSSPTSIIVYTRTPTFTPQPTLTITKTLKPSETPYLLRADFPNACREQYDDNTTHISLNGNWLAEVCYEKEGMQVSNRAGTNTYLVLFKDVYNKPVAPDSRGLVRPVHWSNDSQFIFFTANLEADRVIGSISETTSALFRLKVADGGISQILGGEIYELYYSFSPTDRRLIEVQEFKQPVKIMIHDLGTGESSIVTPVGDPLFSQAGDVIWSPDGLKFAFIAGYGWAYGDESSEQWIHSLIAVDVSTLSQQVIVQKISERIDIVNWDESDIITYTIFDAQANISFKYDYKSNSIISQATVMP